MNVAASEDAARANQTKKFSKKTRESDPLHRGQAVNPVHFFIKM